MVVKNILCFDNNKVTYAPFKPDAQISSHETTLPESLLGWGLTIRIKLISTPLNSYKALALLFSQFIRIPLP